MAGWADWQVALVFALALAALVLAGGSLTWRAMGSPEPRHARPAASAEDRDGDRTATWLRHVRTGVPPLAAAGTRVTSLVLAWAAAVAIDVRAAGRGHASEPLLPCGHHASAACSCWHLNVSGPASPAPPPDPSPGVLPPSPPAAAAAGPETPGDEYAAVIADMAARLGASARIAHLLLAPAPLPPVDQAAHLQPAWQDATDSFAAFVEDDR